MRKLIVVSLTMTLLLSVGGTLTSSFAQSPAPSDTPTFYRLVPGVYVNGWPRFTITYPKDWVERPLAGGGFFAAGPRGVRRGLSVYGIFLPWPVDKYVEFAVPYFKRQATDVTVMSDKPSRLRDGTPAWELELKMTMNGVPLSWMAVATAKEGILVSSNVWTPEGTIGEELRQVAYSFEFKPDKDKPVKVPPDVQAFLDGHRDDNVSHDITKVVSRFSDKYLNTGMTKGKMEQELKQVIDRMTSFEIVITDFVPAGDRAYLAGFTMTNLGKLPITNTAIIKENGRWKWYGNQRNPPPPPWGILHTITALRLSVVNGQFLETLATRDS
jgi:hypothetical protein